MVIEVLAVHAIGLLGGWDAPIGEFLAFELFVITRSVGIVGSSRERPLGVETVIDRELGMLLSIVIRLVGVISSRVIPLAIGNGISACRIIATVGTVDTISGVIVYSIPAHTGALGTAKKACNDLCASPVMP